MTPKEYLKIEAKQRAIIEAAEDVIFSARKKADKAKPPRSKLRLALARDIRIGLIVWHNNGDDGWFWHVVDEPMHFGDDFKAYIADDGCRYGLRGAWVMKD